MTPSYLFFDVAHTLLEKRALYETLFTLVTRYGYEGSLHDMRKIHRLMSEQTVFPSKPDDAWYRMFNARFVKTLGILVSDELLDDIHASCHDLPWVAYQDVSILENIFIPKGIISNWDTTLVSKIHDLVPYLFFPIVVSSCVGISKPDRKIFQIAMKEANVKPDDCWYIGDSLIQDIEPALALGMHAVLVDRYDVHPEYEGKRITNLHSLDLP